MLIAYHGVSDGDFSFLMVSAVVCGIAVDARNTPTAGRPPASLSATFTNHHVLLCAHVQTLGSLFVCFSFILLCIKVAVTRKVSNISLKTLECYALVFGESIVLSWMPRCAIHQSVTDIMAFDEPFDLQLLACAPSCSTRATCPTTRAVSSGLCELLWRC